jgi:methylated-DNA-[protein]-cysteine S-methyltransferase
MIRYCTRPSPIGELLLVGEGDFTVTGIYMEGHARGPVAAADWLRDAAPFSSLSRELDEYFAGTRRRFTIGAANSGSDFQRRVWSALVDIPYGATTSYGALAQKLGLSTAAARAVGAANARNPLSIVVPCHRVVGSDGALTGYAGGEANKRWLLDHERRAA